jgi:hypothetical protein
VSHQWLSFLTYKHAELDARPRVCGVMVGVCERAWRHVPVNFCVSRGLEVSPSPLARDEAFTPFSAFTQWKLQAPVCSSLRLESVSSVTVICVPPHPIPCPIPKPYPTVDGRSVPALPLAALVSAFSIVSFSWYEFVILRLETNTMLARAIVVACDEVSCRDS